MHTILAFLSTIGLMNTPEFIYLHSVHAILCCYSINIISLCTKLVSLPVHVNKIYYAVIIRSQHRVLRQGEVLVTFPEF